MENEITKEEALEMLSKEIDNGSISAEAVVGLCKWYIQNNPVNYAEIDKHAVYIEYDEKKYDVDIGYDEGWVKIFFKERRKNG